MIVLLLLVACGAAPFAAVHDQPARTATLSGQVRDESGAPIAGAAITVTAAAGGAVSRTTSDADGSFEIRDLASGRYSVIGEQPGLLPAVIPEVILAPGSSRSLILELKVPGITEVVAVGAEFVVPEAAPSVVDVPPIVVKSVAGGGENIFRVLQVLPGVAALNDFDSRMSVRGGSPDQNLTMMDGVEIHNPYRLFGLTSAFNPETVTNFELTTGGFNAQYGDRLSSVLVVENRPGSTASSIGGSAAMSITDANIVAEGRLPGMTGSSWLVTGRSTYYQLVAERIVDADLPSFADLQGRVDMLIKPGHRLTVSALTSRESADGHFEDEDENPSGEVVDLLLSTHNDLAAATYAATISARAFSKTTVSWYRNKELGDFSGALRSIDRSNREPDEDVEDGNPLNAFRTGRQLSIRDIAVRQQFGINAGTSHLLETGFELHHLDTTWQWRTSGAFDEFGGPNGISAPNGATLPASLDSARSTLRSGAWLTDRWTVTPRLRFEPGVRVDWSGVNGETTGSPRLAAMFDVTARTRVRVAGGVFTQSPGYEKLIQSNYFVDLTDNGPLSVRSERAWHGLAAVEQRLDNGVMLRVEGYYKDFDRLIVGRLETPAERVARIATYDFPKELQFGIPTAPQVTTNPVNTGVGRAYGVEFYAEKRATSSSRLSGWASYTFGRAETTAYGRTYPADYDRRHALSFVTSFHANRLLEIAATFRAQSGFPYTPPLLVVPAAIEDPAAAAAGVTRLVPQYDSFGLVIWTPDYGDTSNFNSARLPFYARLDLRATFRPRWMNDRWQIYGEVVNVLNRDNTSSLDVHLIYDPKSDRPRIELTNSDALPFLPTFGLRYRF